MDALSRITFSIFAGLVVIGLLNSFVKPDPEVITQPRPPARVITEYKTKTVVKEVATGIPKPCMDAIESLDAVLKTNDTVADSGEAIYFLLRDATPRSMTDPANAYKDQNKLRVLLDEIESSTVEGEETRTNIDNLVSLCKQSVAMSD